MKKKEYLTMDRFDKFSDLMMESFAHLNVKIDESIKASEERLGKRIDSLEFKVDTGFREVNNRIDDLAETKVSRHEQKPWNFGW
ncbi:MAG: hypothetical protein WC763_00035 [Candidatus Paceibacterota bacterium]|jgi:hypothetical protein